MGVAPFSRDRNGPQPKKGFVMTTDKLCSPTVTVAVLYVAADGRKAIAAIRNVPHDEVTLCVDTLRKHGTETGYTVAAYCTSAGYIELVDSSIVETDILQLVAEVDRPSLQLVENDPNSSRDGGAV
jgi:hypothetical protein